jgi:sugar diacid utilization regulator
MRPWSACVRRRRRDDRDREKRGNSGSSTRCAARTRQWGPSGPPREAARSWEWARQTLQLVESGLIQARGLVHAEDHLAAIFSHEDPTLVDALAARWLAPLGSLPESSRRDLPETLLAWLSRDRDVRQAAEDLNCHPNTVRYRMAKLRRLYGATLEDPEARFELQIALPASGIQVGHGAALARADGHAAQARADGHAAQVSAI